MTTDGSAGSRLAVEHLVSLGHERIGHVTAGAGARRRERVYLAAREAAGLETMVLPDSYLVAAGSVGANTLMARKVGPMAIFAANDLAALGAINRLAWLGYRVLEDVAVIGFADIPLASSEPIALTTPRQRVPELVDAAIRFLLERLNDMQPGNPHMLVPAELVVRRKSGPSIG